MDLQACPRCASLRLKLPGIAEGGVPGVSSNLANMVCEDCDFAGVPLSFPDRAAYEAFRGERAGRREWIDVTDDDVPAELQALIDETKAPRPARASAVVMAILGGLALGLGLLILAAGLLSLNFSGATTGLFSVAIGASFITVAARMWRK